MVRCLKDIPAHVLEGAYLIPHHNKSLQNIDLQFIKTKLEKFGLCSTAAWRSERRFGLNTPFLKFLTLLSAAHQIYERCATERLAGKISISEIITYFYAKRSHAIP